MQCLSLFLKELRGGSTANSGRCTWLGMVTIELCCAVGSLASFTRRLKPLGSLLIHHDVGNVSTVRISQSELKKLFAESAMSVHRCCA